MFLRISRDNSKRRPTMLVTFSHLSEPLPLVKSAKNCAQSTVSCYQVTLFEPFMKFV